MRSTAYTAFAVSIFLGFPASAATLDSIKGTVLINRGEGFRPLAGTAQANIGDTIMVSPGSSARVVYPDGCPVPVKPGQILTIAAESPCTAFAQAGPPPRDDRDDDAGFWLGVAGSAVVIGAWIWGATQGQSGPTGGAAPASP